MIIINIIVNNSSNDKDSAAERNEYWIFRITPESDHFRKESPTVTFFELLHNANMHNVIFIHFCNYYDKSVFIMLFVRAKEYSLILLRHIYLL